MASTTPGVKFNDYDIYDLSDKWFQSPYIPYMSTSSHSQKLNQICVSTCMWATTLESTRQKPIVKLTKSKQESLEAGYLRRCDSGLLECKNIRWLPFDLDKPVAVSKFAWRYDLKKMGLRLCVENDDMLRNLQKWRNYTKINGKYPFLRILVEPINQGLQSQQS